MHSYDPISADVLEDGLTYPNDFVKIWNNILDMRKERNAPVDTMGCEFLADRTIADPKTVRFQTLVAGILSSQTKDEATAACMGRLQDRELSVQLIRDIDEDVLSDILYGVSFHKNKAKYLKKTAEILFNDYDSDVPATLPQLLKLPGVGLKIGTLALQSCWNKQEGIVVDVHVHRICNRLGWVNTKKPEETHDSLIKWLPPSLRADINLLMVGLGQQVCMAPVPRCGMCSNRDSCKTGRGRKSDWENDVSKGKSRVAKTSIQFEKTIESDPKAWQDIINDSVKAEVPVLESDSSTTLKETDNYEKQIKTDVDLENFACKDEDAAYKQEPGSTRKRRRI